MKQKCESIAVKLCPCDRFRGKTVSRPSYLLEYRRRVKSTEPRFFRSSVKISLCCSEMEQNLERRLWHLGVKKKWKSLKGPKKSSAEFFFSAHSWRTFSVKAFPLLTWNWTLFWTGCRCFCCVIDQQIQTPSPLEQIQIPLITDTKVFSIDTVYQSRRSVRFHPSCRFLPAWPPGPAINLSAAAVICGPHLYVCLWENGGQLSMRGHLSLSSLLHLLSNTRSFFNSQLQKKKKRSFACPKHLRADSIKNNAAQKTLLF